MNQIPTSILAVVSKVFERVAYNVISEPENGVSQNKTLYNGSSKN